MLGLNLPQFLQYSWRDDPSQEPPQRSFAADCCDRSAGRWQSRRQGITDDLQPQQLVPAMRKNGQFKGQIGNIIPGYIPASPQFIKIGTAKVRSSPYSRWMVSTSDCPWAPSVAWDALGLFGAEIVSGELVIAPSFSAAIDKRVVARLLGLSTVSPQPPSEF